MELHIQVEYDEDHIRAALLELKESGKKPTYENILPIVLRIMKSKIVTPEKGAQ